jgi:hypothetical protein
MFMGWQGLVKKSVMTEGFAAMRHCQIGFSRTAQIS